LYLTGDYQLFSTHPQNNMEDAFSSLCDMFVWGQRPCPLKSLSHHIQIWRNSTGAVFRADSIRNEFL